MCRIVCCVFCFCNITVWCSLLEERKNISITWCTINFMQHRIRWSGISVIYAIIHIINCCFKIHLTTPTNSQRPLKRNLTIWIVLVHQHYLLICCYSLHTVYHIGISNIGMNIKLTYA